jgi:hypothetical protein
MVTPMAGGGFRIVNTGGGGAFDASAVSTTAIAGDFVLRGASGTPALSAFIAVTADPTESNGYLDLDHSIQIFGDDFFMLEDGIFHAPTGAHGGAVWIERRGSTLRYRTGASFASSVVRRTVAGVSAPLFFDSSIATVAGVLEVRFEPPGRWLARARQSRIALGIGL